MRKLIQRLRAWWDAKPHRYPDDTDGPMGIIDRGHYVLGSPVHNLPSKATMEKLVQDGLFEKVDLAEGTVYTPSGKARNLWDLERVHKARVGWEDEAPESIAIKRKPYFERAGIVAIVAKTSKPGYTDASLAYALHAAGLDPATLDDKEPHHGTPRPIHPARPARA